MIKANTETMLTLLSNSPLFVHTDEQELVSTGTSRAKKAAISSKFYGSLPLPDLENTIVNPDQDGLVH
jgi:hypothetical protein